MAPGVVLETAVAAPSVHRRIRFSIEEAAPEIHDRPPKLPLQIYRSGKWRLFFPFDGLALNAHGGGERIVELPGRLLAGLHQAFEIGGGTAWHGRLTHMQLLPSG